MTPKSGGLTLSLLAVFGSMILRTSRTSWARTEEDGSAVVFPVLMTNDFGVLGSFEASTFFTCVRFLTRFLAILVVFGKFVEGRKDLHFMVIVLMREYMAILGTFANRFY